MQYNFPRVSLINKLICINLIDIIILNILHFIVEIHRPCSFEGNMCGYTNIQENDFDWFVYKPVASMDNQKPKTDRYNLTYGKNIVIILQHHYIAL